MRVQYGLVKVRIYVYEAEVYTQVDSIVNNRFLSEGIRLSASLGTPALLSLFRDFTILVSTCHFSFDLLPQEAILRTCFQLLLSNL